MSRGNKIRNIVTLIAGFAGGIYFGQHLPEIHFEKFKPYLPKLDVEPVPTPMLSKQRKV